MKLQRLLGILAVLLKRSRVSAESLAERFEVSVRTIYRDLEALEQAGVPIVTFPGVNGGVEILDTYKLDKTVFLSEDFEILLTGLQSVSGTMDQARLNRTLEKLRSLIPERQAERVQVLGKKIYVDLKPWSVHPEFEPVFSQVRAGLEGDRLIRFSYTARESGSRLRTVEPHQLILKEQNWYLRAYCLERGDFRTFRLQRMESVQVLDQRFTPREFSNDLEDFKEWAHPRTIRVELVVKPCKRRAVLEYCRPEYLSELPDGNIRIDLPFVESEIGYGVLLQMGPDCRVIGPDFVVEELKSRLRQMCRVYGL